MEKWSYFMFLRLGRECYVVVHRHKAHMYVCGGLLGCGWVGGGRGVLGGSLADTPPFIPFLSLFLRRLLLPFGEHFLPTLRSFLTGAKNFQL